MTTTETRNQPPAQQSLDGSSCDRCTAEGRVLVGQGKLRMVLCGHHYRRHEDALATDGWRVVADSRPDITPSN